MAVDKLVDSTQLDADLTSVANAIRTKGGTSAQLAFPAGFVSAVEAIPTGISPTGTISITENGSYDVTSYANAAVNVGADTNPLADDNDVILIDYDGTIRYSYTKAQFLALTEYPPNPTHAGLTAQGWNWTLSDAKAYVTDYGVHVIGQQYVTSDGKTRLYISLSNPCLSPTLGLCVNGTATVDWGDDSNQDTITGSSLTTVINTQHTYASSGEYVIAISVSGKMRLPGNYSTGSKVIWDGNSSYLSANRKYFRTLKKVRIGNNCSIMSAVFHSCDALETITIPKSEDITTIPDDAFHFDYALKGMVIPEGITEIRGYSLYQAETMIHVSIPNSLTTSYGTNPFYGCESLNRLVLPDKAFVLGSSFVYHCGALSRVTIPKATTRIDNQAFNTAASLKELHFTAETPTPINASNAFAYLPASCVIYVPAGHLSDYTSAANYPSSATYTYVEE